MRCVLKSASSARKKVTMELRLEVVNVCDVLRNVGFSDAHWESLASQLGVRDPRSILETHPHSPQLRMQETISRWLQQDPKRSWFRLALAVRKVEGYGDATAKHIIMDSEKAQELERSPQKQNAQRSNGGRMYTTRHLLSGKLMFLVVVLAILLVLGLIQLLHTEHSVTISKHTDICRKAQNPYEVRKTVLSLQTKFANLVVRVMRNLKKKVIDLDEFKSFLRLLPASRSPCAYKLLLDHDMKTFETCDNIHCIFDLLAFVEPPWWDYRNYHILSNIIEEYGDGNDSVKQMLNVYERNLEAFRSQTNLCDFICVMHFREEVLRSKLNYNYALVLIELQKSCENYTNVAEAEQVGWKYLEELHVLEYVKFVGATGGSVRLWYLVPSSIVPYMIEESRNKREFFKYHQVIRLTIGDTTVYKYQQHPTITKLFQEDSAEDEDVTFVCDVSCTVDYNVTWLHNGTPIHTINGSYQEHANGSRHKLKVDIKSPDVVGLYTCVVNSVYHANETSLNIRLQMTNPGEHAAAVCSPTERRIKAVNDTVELRCNCEMPQLPPNTLEVRWYRNGSELVRHVTNGDRNWTFTVGEQDGGIYSCQCEPCNAQCSLCYRLAVEPHITYFDITPSIVRVGERINVTCTAVGYPLPHNFLVFKTGGVPGSFDNLHPMGNGITGTTTAMLSQNGTYECRAQNSIPPDNAERFDTRTASVLVYEPPWIVGTRNHTVRGDILGMEVYLECEVQGTPTASEIVTWLRNGEVLSSQSGKYQQLNSPTSTPREDRKLLYLLRVSNLTEDDIGEYICKVGSQYNETEDEATVFILLVETTVVSSATTSGPTIDVPGGQEPLTLYLSGPTIDVPGGQDEGSASDPTDIYIAIAIRVLVAVFYVAVAMLAITIVCLLRKRGKELSVTVSLYGPPGEVGASNSETSFNGCEDFNFTDGDTSSHHSGTPPAAADGVHAVVKGVSAEDAPNLRQRVLSSGSPTET